MKQTSNAQRRTSNVQLELSPEFARGETEISVLIRKSVFAIRSQEQWAVEIYEIGGAGEHSSWSHSQRSAHHATYQQSESAFTCSLAQMERFSQPAGFVEFYVHGFVAIFQARKINSRMATFIGAHRYWMIESFENFIGIGWKRLFDQFNA